MRIIDYNDYPLDAGSLLSEFRLTKEYISPIERAQTVQYLERFLREKPSDEAGQFTIRNVTIRFRGHDEAGYFLQHFN